MNQAKTILAALLAAVTVLALPAITQAQPQAAPQYPQINPDDLPYKATFIRLGNGVPGVLYEPRNLGEKSQIAVFVMHSGGDYLAMSACTELSKRGYRVLCANNTTSKQRASGDGNLDRILLDAKLGVAYLKQFPAVKKIVLLGHSGGGTLMSAYQLVAENGVKACQGPEKIYKCNDNLAGLPAADGVMLVDSNWGLAEMMLFSIDPSVTDDKDGMKTDPALDVFNPANGFKPQGSAYSPEFIKNFQSAVSKRNNRLIQSAQDRLAAIKSGKGLFNDDEPFTIAGAGFQASNNRLFAQDVSLMSHTQKAWPLLHKGGVVTNEIVHSVRIPENTRSTTPSMENGALKATVRNFLSTYAIRTTADFGYGADSVHGIDWTSTYSSPPGDVEGITVPLLTMGMTAHWEYLAAETIYNHAKSADKTLAFIEGATHGYTPCAKCEKTPGEFGDTVKTTYDYVDSWLSKKGRFLH